VKWGEARWGKVVDEVENQNLVIPMR
jgi:hypothetical protein